MLGTNHERAAIELREQLAFGPETIGDGLRELRTLAHEGAILSTCNRTEVYALLDDDLDGERELRRFLAGTRDVTEQTVADSTHSAGGHHAVHHLYRVSCGLDSMMLGEPQILTQVQDALTTARTEQAAGPIVTRLFTEALRVGKLSRTETGIARNRLSIAHAAIDLATRELGNLAGRTAIVVGAGKMATLAAKLLRSGGVADLVIANRSDDRGMELAATVEGRYVPLDALPHELPDADLVVSAAAATAFVIDTRTTTQCTTPTIMIDLSVPRTIDPDLAGPLVRVFSVDDLEEIAADTRVGYAREIRRAEAMVDEAVGEFFAWWRVRDVAPTLQALREHNEQVRRSEVDRALRKLGHLSDRDREIVEALSVALVGKLMHQPIQEIKRTAEMGAHESPAELVRRMFGLE